MKEEKQEAFKVKAGMRFLYAPTGRIYDKDDVFEVKTKEDQDYLISNKLAAKAKPDDDITETDQDKRDKAAEVEAKRVEDERLEALKAIAERSVRDKIAEENKSKEATDIKPEVKPKAEKKAPDLKKTAKAKK